MIKECRKVVTIKAGQFDGSDEMISHYYLFVYGKEEEECLIAHYYLKTLAGNLEINIVDWIATVLLVNIG
jgi:hypothetical protein